MKKNNGCFSQIYYNFTIEPMYNQLDFYAQVLHLDADSSLCCLKIYISVENDINFYDNIVSYIFIDGNIVCYIFIVNLGHGHGI